MGSMRRVLFACFLAFVAAGAATVVASADNISAENLAFSIGPTNYRIPRIFVEGAGLTPSDVARIFDGKAPAPAKERFARLTASRIIIPQIAGETAAAGAAQRFLYKDVVLEKVNSGRIGAARAASLEQTIDRPQGGRVIAHYGPIGARNVDLAQIAHVYGESGAGNQEPMKGVDEDLSVENITLSVPDSGFELRVGRLTATDAKARATNRPLAHWFDDASSVGAPPTPEQSAALALAAMDAIAGFEVGRIEAQDVSASSAGAKPFTLTIKRASLGKIVNSTIGELSMEDLSYFAADSSKATLRRATMRGLELRPLFEQSGRQYPRFAHIDLAGVDANLPDPTVGDVAREKFRIVFGALDLGAYRDNAPTRISSRLDHCVIDLTERAGAPADAQLIALGYKEVDLSWALDGEWREKEQEITLRQAMLEGKDMGRVAFTATLENVSPLLFSPVPVLARAAAVSALAKRLDASFEDMTLIDRTIDAEAKSRGVDPAKLRSDYAVSTTAVILAFFDNDEKARPLAEAIGKFVASPKQLRLHLQSAKGIGFLTAMTSKPSEILQLIDIEAKTTR
jgi:hypothetical protein